ncbi:partial Aldo-keto reductase IolS, partial [Anaerolineae bacterium]
AIQQRLNIFEGDAETLRVCEEHHLASINRSPLAMGLLTGKFTAHTQFPKDDVRSTRFDFEKEKGEQLRMLDAIRTILTQDGRSLAQAALGWLWARSPMTIPIPGFKTIAQVEENSRAMDFGPLADTQMKQIERVLRD